MVPGEHVDLGDAHVQDGWVVWWRRAGVPAPDLSAGAPPPDALLLASELRDIVVGGLLSLRLRWVDEPYAVLRAEQKMLQLATARRLGIPMPATVATKYVGRARQILAAGPMVAKAISSGPGLAPYADVVNGDLAPRVAVAPTTLQSQVPSTADLRVVVVGDQTLSWCRPREYASSVDWRQDDRRGVGFVYSRHEAVGDMAVAMNHGLGLTFSVQDWVIDAAGDPIFLEVNPCGSWMFLNGAADRVALALARHLMRMDIR